MRRPFHSCTLLLFLALLVAFPTLNAQSTTYKTPGQVSEWIRQLQANNPGSVSSNSIATSPGERPVEVIRIGKNPENQESPNPSVFVGANLEGNRPLATEGAMQLAELILSEASNYESLNWYILALGNPDAAARYFQAPLFEDSRNDLPNNDDQDDQIDEDGVNDLNGDGWITKMRVIDPGGDWMTSEADPRILRKADPTKGEQGSYQLYTEGIDDDQDGSYNEDGPGGTNVAINFPQFFQHFTAEGGKFPGSTPESYAIMKFVYDHPDIAMIVSLGSTNWCYSPPEGGRKGEADLNKIRLSERQARQLNLDRSRTYSIKELVDIFRAENPGMNIDEGVIAGYLGLGAALNPQAGDLLFYEKYNKAYRSYLQEQGLTQQRIKPEAARDGSFELWAYFQVGVPVFSMDLWGITKDSSEMKPASAWLAWADRKPGSSGFVDWEPFEHPSLGPVEIGGFIPYLTTTPPFEWVDSLLQIQLPWILELAGELPDLHIYEVKTSDLGQGVFQLDIWIENSAFIPFPTDMGSRNRQPAPAILTLEGEEVELLSGLKRTPIARVAGKSRVKTSLILRKEKAGEITLKLAGPSTGSDQKTIKIGG